MMVFYVIRMWAPPAETNSPLEPHFAQRVEREGRPTQWTLSRDFSEANIFKNEREAVSVICDVRRISERIKRGWFFEVIRIQEDIVATNVPKTEVV